MSRWGPLLRISRERLGFGNRAIMEKWVLRVSVAPVWRGSKAQGDRTMIWPRYLTGTF